MIQLTFTGQFLKPVEAFLVQSFDAVDLNRLAPELLVWILGITAVGLVLHFCLETLPALRSRGARK